MKIYYVTVGEKAAYVNAVDMKQAINKIENAKVFNLDETVEISTMEDLTGILADSNKEEVKVNAIVMTNGDRFIYPVKSVDDIKKAVLNPEVESTGEYTEKAYIIK